MAQRKTWSTEEDNFIRLKVEQNSKLPDKDRLKWGDIADHLNQKFPDSQRSGKQCRQRWHNQLDPSILHKEWSFEEEKKLFDLQKKLGNKWAEIASNMKGRTDNNVKNYFYSTLRKSLRKLNTFISLNRMELKAAKEFKQSSLSKLLAVADHKFDKKINVKKVSAQIEAVQIKNMLIEITRLEVGDSKSAPVFFGLVKKLQQWNKCCKKKKGKKKQEIEVGDQDGNPASEDQEEDEAEDDGKEIQQSKKDNNLQKSGLSRISRVQRSRSRNNRISVEKKHSNVSKSSKMSKNNKKTVKQDKKPKEQVKVPQIPQISSQRSSSRQISNLSGSNFIDMSRSSLDLGKNQKRSSGESMNYSSNLFKSFIMDGNQDNIQESKEKSPQKGQQSKTRVTRSSSNFKFLDMIKEVSFQRKQSQKSGFDDFFRDDDHAFGIRLMKKESSKRELPMIKDESFGGFALAQSYRFEPQIRKLRSWRNDSSNFELKYDFGQDNVK